MRSAEISLKRNELRRVKDDKDRAMRDMDRLFWDLERAYNNLRRDCERADDIARSKQREE